jgi:hypothetical protein
MPHLFSLRIPLSPFDEGQSLAISRDAYLSEPVLAIDPGPQRELDLPASHNSEITSSRRPIRRDDVVEELPRTTSRKGNAEKRAGLRSHQSQRISVPTKKRELTAGRYGKELRVGNVQAPGLDVVVPGHEEPVRIDSPRRAIDN